MPQGFKSIVINFKNSITILYAKQISIFNFIFYFNSKNSHPYHETFHLEIKLTYFLCLQAIDISFLYNAVPKWREGHPWNHHPLQRNVKREYILLQFHFLLRSILTLRQRETFTVTGCENETPILHTYVATS